MGRGTRCLLGLTQTLGLMPDMSLTAYADGNAAPRILADRLESVF